MSRMAEGLDVPASVSTGASQTVNEWRSFTCIASSVPAFVATWQVQISADGVNWFNEGSPIVGPGSLQVTKECMFVRADVTSHSSGTPVGYVVGEV
jgi:hypothetical protein